MRDALESYLGRFLLFTLALLATANLVSLGAVERLSFSGHSVSGSTFWGRAGVVPTMLVVSSAIIATVALRESVRSGRLTAALALMQRLESARVRQMRTFLRTHVEDIRLALNSGGVEAFDTYILENGEKQTPRITVSDVWDDLAVLEQSAIMALNGMIPKVLELTFYSTVVLESWPNVKSIAEARRKALGTEVYLQHLEALHDIALSGELFAWNARRRAKRLSLRQIRKRSQAFASSRREASLRSEMGDSC